jgi:hypothetical protein
MKKHVGRACLVALGLALSCGAAWAGAWTLNAGEGSVIATGSFSAATRAYDGKGNLAPATRYAKQEAQALIEYGAADWLTLMFAPSLQHVDIAGPFASERLGLGYTEAGARARLWQNESWVFSAQAVLRMPGTFDNSNVAAIGYTDGQVDVRALAGYSFSMGPWPAFVDVQLAQRFRSRGAPDEFRADVTFGFQPLDRWRVLVQSFNVVSEGAGSWGYPQYAYYKAQLSAVYSLTQALAVQFGGFTTFSGHNAIQENGLILAAWYKF